VNFYAAVVGDEAKVPELVHERRGRASRVLLQPEILRLLPHLVLVPAKEASGFRHRPAVGDFVRQVTDVHYGPGLA
jgi:hypothetical protein